MIHHRQHADGFPLQYLDDLLARRDISHHGDHAALDLADRLRGIGQRQVLDVHPPDEASVVVDHEKLSQSAPAYRAQAFDRLGDRHPGTQRTDPCVHQAARGVFRKRGVLAQFVGYFAIEARQQFFAFVGLQLREHRHTRSRLGFGQHMTREFRRQVLKHFPRDVRGERLPGAHHGARRVFAQQLRRLGSRHRLQAARGLAGEIDQEALIQSRDHRQRCTCGQHRVGRLRPVGRLRLSAHRASSSIFPETGLTSGSRVATASTPPDNASQ